MSLLLQALPAITFHGETGERNLLPAQHAATIRHLAAAIGHEFPDATRLGLIWHTTPELVLLWLAILAAGREPLLLQYPNEKQNLVHWRESIAVSADVADLGGIVVADDPRLREIDFTAVFCPPPELFTAAAGHASAPADGALGGAFLQMSSGTTGHRKPIRFELAEVSTHVRQFNRVLGLGQGDTIVSWLPLYHDMGFVACFLMPLLLGIPLVLIDPMDWIRRPGLLTEAIRRHAGTVCYMPNFGFEVMSRQADHAPTPTMRKWISCSEPVYADTLRRFAQAFAVPEEALAVCYAMAENIFAVTFRDGIRTFPADGRDVVSCGQPIPGTEIGLRDGEILVRSEVSLKGYVNSAPIIDGEGRYPTGDLGRIVDGELLVTGRKRDLVNIAGRKYMLNDLDQAMQALVPEARGRLAAVPWRNERLGTETPLLLVETDDFFLRTDQGVLGAALARETGIEAVDVRFVPPRFIVKTSSGKVNRASTAEHYRQALAWQQEGRPGTRSPEEAIAAHYAAVPRDRPVRELFDSLGLTSLAIALDEFDIALEPGLSIDEHLALHRRRQSPQPAAAEAAPGHLSIVSLADARLTRRWTDRHLETIAGTLGCPVSFEYLCLPPVPVVLSDLVFHDYFLPRETNKEKYREVRKILTRLKEASIVLVDDVAELVFGGKFAPFLDHRLQRSEPADLLIYRWQQYSSNHHELPLGLANLFGTTSLRNEYIERLSRYLGVPVFRIATLTSHESVTRDWDYVARVNADWDTRLTSHSDEMVGALARFMCLHQDRMPMRRGPMRRGIRHVGLVHFCCMAADRQRLDALLERYDRYCLFGPRASLPYLRRTLDALGKPYVVADRSADLRPIEDQFDCVLQTGSTGHPRTDKPVFQIFWASWDYADHPHPHAYAGLNSYSFHANPREVVNELPLIRELPDPCREAIRLLKKHLRESERQAPGSTQPGGEPDKFARPPASPAIYPEFLELDQGTYAEAERLLAAGRQDEAGALLESMVTNGTALWQAHNDLGVLSLQRGEVEAAIRHLQTAASLEGGTTSALRNLAEACVQAGRLAEALAACAHILRREPDAEEVTLFVKNLLAESNASLGDPSWLVPELAAQRYEVVRLRQLLDTCESRIGQLEVRDAFFHQARKVLDGFTD